MKILVIGKTGQLARALANQAKSTEGEMVCLGRDILDLSWPEQKITQALARQPKPDIIILAAAFTDVAAAENAPQEAMSINAKATKAIAQHCKTNDIPLIYISTDYVFSGETKTPYLPEDAPAPLNAYGASKLAGEQAVRVSACAFCIIRTAWVYDIHANNFATKMLALSKSDDRVSVVDDQLGRPTYAPHLAAGIMAAARAIVAAPQTSFGTHHFSGTGPIINWADFARSIFESFGKDTIVSPVKSTDFPSPVQRPSFSALDTSSFEAAFDFAIPDWQMGLKQAKADFDLENAQRLHE